MSEFLAAIGARRERGRMLFRLKFLATGVATQPYRHLLHIEPGPGQPCFGGQDLEGHGEGFGHDGGQPTVLDLDADKSLLAVLGHLVLDETKQALRDGKFVHGGVGIRQFTLGVKKRGAASAGHVRGEHHGHDDGRQEIRDLDAQQSQHVDADGHNKQSAHGRELGQPLRGEIGVRAGGA